MKCVSFTLINHVYINLRGRTKALLSLGTGHLLEAIMYFFFLSRKMEKAICRIHINFMGNLKDIGSDFQKEINAKMHMLRLIKNTVSTMAIKSTLC